MCEGARCGARAAIYGKMLCDEGYEHVYSLTFTEAELLEMEDGNGEKVPKGRAHRMVAAATAVLRSVGVFVGGSARIPPQAAHPAIRAAVHSGPGLGGPGLVSHLEASVGVKDRGPCAPYPKGRVVDLTGWVPRDEMVLWVAGVVVDLKAWSGRQAGRPQGAPRARRPLHVATLRRIRVKKKIR